MPIVTMAIQYLPIDMVVREAQTNFHGGVQLDTCLVQVLCRRHSLDHRKGGGPATQHQGTANSSE